MPSEGIACCEIYPISTRDEQLYVQFEHGVVTRIAVLWSDDGTAWRQAIRIFEAEMKAKCRDTGIGNSDPYRPFAFMDNFRPERFILQIDTYTNQAAPTEPTK